MPRRTHEDAQRTKQAILESAMRLFSRRGYESTSLSDIARYAGVTRGAIYWHFNDKDQILIELCKNIGGDDESTALLVQAADPNEDDPLGKIRDWLIDAGDDERIRFYTSALFGLVRKIMTGASGTDEVRSCFHELFDHGHQLLNAALRNAMYKRQLPASSNCELLSQVIDVFFCGFVNLISIGKCDEVIRNHEQVVDTIIRTMAEGLTVPPERR